MLGLLLAGMPTFAVSTYKGVQPGKTTRAEVDRIFGQPKRAISGTLFEYSMTDGPGQLVIDTEQGPVLWTASSDSLPSRFRGARCGVPWICPRLRKRPP